MWNMALRTLGQEIRRLRQQARLTLRGLARAVRVSAAHLSDIEHDRRRPSEELLQRIAHELRTVGATFESLERTVTGLDEETRTWVAATPGARALLRKVMELGKDPEQVLSALEQGASLQLVKKKRSSK